MPETDSKTDVYIGLGANQGDRAGNIHRAVKQLGETEGISLSSMSEVIETKALSRADQADYLNAVARINTDIEADELLGRLQEIEESLGRVRAEKWGDRTIDLDILLYGDEVIETERLVVPHGQMHLRSFVLRGMCELSPDLTHPVLKRSMKELADRLGGCDFVLDEARPQLVSVAGLIGIGKTTLASGLAGKFGCAMIAEAYDTNPFIEEAAMGNVDLALKSQFYFLNSRMEQIGKDVLQAGRVYVSDYVFDKDMIFAKLTLDAGQFEQYQEQYRRTDSNVCDPVLTIYLNDSEENCLDRIHNRNRSYEQQIAPETLKEFSDEYDRLFENWKKSPLIRLGLDSFDCRAENDIEKLAEEIGLYIVNSCIF